MAITRGAVAQLLAPGLNLMYEWLDEHPEEYPDVVDVDTMDGAYSEDQVFAGFGQAIQFYEGEPTPADDPVQGSSKRYNPNKYGIKFAVSEEALDDDKYSFLRRMPKELAKSIRYTVETVAVTPYTSGFSGGTVTAADGLTLFNSAHALLSGGTYSNVLSTAAALSVTSLQDLLLKAEKVENERGLKMACSPDQLLIPPDLEFLAVRTLQSQFLPSTGNNDVNPVQGRLQIVVNHYFTDTDNWFIRDSSIPEAGPRIIWRKKPVASSWDDPDTGGAIFKMICRFAVGTTDWRGVYGTNP